MPAKQGQAQPGQFRVNLARARDRRNLTQEQLAELVGMSREAVAAWEAGRAYPKFEIVYRISVALNVPLRDLLDGFDQKPGPEKEELLAEKIASRVAEILKSRDGYQISDHDWDRFLRDLNITELSQDALVPAALGGRVGDAERRVVREATAYLPKEVLESIVGEAARLVVDRVKKFMSERHS